MSETAMSREDYRAAYDDDADNVRGGPTGERVDLLAALGAAVDRAVITGVSSPSTFAEAFAAQPTSCPGCERARSVAVGLQGEVERLTATLARVEALAEAIGPDLRWATAKPVKVALGTSGFGAAQKDAPNARAWHHKDSRPWLETVLASESMGHADALAKASPNPSFNPSPEPSVKPSQEPSK